MGIAKIFRTRHNLLCQSLGWHRRGHRTALSQIAISIYIDYKDCKEEQVVYDDMMHFLDYLLGGNHYYAEIWARPLLCSRFNTCAWHRNSIIKNYSILSGHDFSDSDHDFSD